MDAPNHRPTFNHILRNGSLSWRLGCNTAPTAISAAVTTALEPSDVICLKQAKIKLFRGLAQQWNNVHHGLD